MGSSGNYFVARTLLSLTFGVRLKESRLGGCYAMASLWAARDETNLGPTLDMSFAWSIKFVLK